MGHVQEIAHKEMAHPEAQQASARLTTPEELKRAQEQIDSADPSEAAELKADKDREGGQSMPDKQNKRREEQTDVAEDSMPRDDSGPWQGNIVNLKV